MTIMLLCGSGASSGFMAANIRKAAKRQGENCKVIARSDSELMEYLEEVDVILLGSHLEYLLSEIRSKADPYNVPVDVISGRDYGMLDGKKVLEQALSLYMKRRM